jgi:hypothetical protein
VEGKIKLLDINPQSLEIETQCKVTRT